jgi:signal transduction histidine kinase
MSTRNILQRPASQDMPPIVPNRGSVRKNTTFLPNRLGALGTLGATYSSTDVEMERLSIFLTQGSQAGFLIWITLMCLVFYFAPPDSYEYCEGAELNANVLVFVLLLVTNGSKLLPMYFNESTKFMKTGAMIGSCTVQGIALTSVGMMIFFPTPVMMDVVTNRRVHMVRWAEWVPLAFLMTFLTEGIDLPNHQQAVNVAWAHAWAIALSTSAGIIFPFCAELWEWLVVFVFACILFSSLYIRLYHRTVRFTRTPKGNNVDEQESYDRVRLSLRLLQACSFMWTGLVLSFVACCFLPIYAPEGSFWASPALPLVSESFFEIGSKVWYLILIVDIHELVFDEGSRATRRLEEMRSMMSVVWETSSDVIALCVRGKETINAVVSPTFLHMGQKEATDDDDKKIALIFEVTPQANNPNNPIHKIAAMNVTHPTSRREVLNQADLLAQFVDDEEGSTDQRNVASMAKLLAKAWHFTNRESLVMHDLYAETATGKVRTIQCEAKITKLANDAVVVVLRDISERFERFETEKQLVVAVTERKKDSEANRFARHEVKNTLLAAIGLVDSIKEAIESGGDTVTGRTKITQALMMHKQLTQSAPDQTKDDAEIPQDFSGCMRELDFTLREVLDKMMVEAMTRDVVNEIYQVCNELTDIRNILSNFRHHAAGTEDRFPIVEQPDPLPELLVDRELVRLIHRNAVSNAIKYGKPGGVVTTYLDYDSFKHEFRMRVTNQPGMNHAVLLAMNETDKAKVFSAGARLEVNHAKTTATAEDSFGSPSTGDGAWIMQKCAKTMGGYCEIKFEKEVTTLLFCCSADPSFDEMDASGRTNNDPGLLFALPANTWGIALDDSSIQRRLLDRFLSLAGVERSRRKILGGTSKEILGFKEYLGNLIRNNPRDKFLVIVDESLDIVDEGKNRRTVSGSKFVEMLNLELGFEDGRRMLALIRSVKDSNDDIAIYKARAHGFIPKAPIQKDKVLEMIEPWWKHRFPISRTSRPRRTEPIATIAEKRNDSDDEEEGVGIEDLMETIQHIDALLEGNSEDELAESWLVVRDHLHSLRGDLTSWKINERVTTVLDAMDKLTGETVPNELSERWKLIRSLIVSML